ncbi:MAG: LysR family transcriptional regulator [Desulfopila sp.]
MDTNTLQAFLAVAESGTFSRAAERLLLTQPAVSKRISALEEELSAKLFERLGRKVMLTEAGRVLLPKARHILEEMADSRLLIANLASEVTGVLQLATSHHIGLRRLPGVLRSYRRRYPQVDFDLHFMNSEAGYGAVAAGDVELALVTLPEALQEHLEITPVWEDPLLLMVGREYVLASERGNVAVLMDHAAILPERGTVTRRLIDEGLAILGIVPRVGVETNYLETIRMLVAAGFGWSVLPLAMLDSDLRVIELAGVRFHRRLGLVHRRNRTISKAARAFCDMLVVA